MKLLHLIIRVGYKIFTTKLFEFPRAFTPKELKMVTTNLGYIKKHIFLFENAPKP